MGIKFDIIAEKLRDKYSLVHQCALEETEIICAKLLQREIVSLDPGVIYIGKISDFPVDAEDSDKSGFVISVDSPNAALPLGCGSITSYLFPG